MKLGLGFLGGPDLRALVEIGRSAEEAGFDAATLDDGGIGF